MITIKASQKIFNYAEVANLTGICAEHLHNFANRHRLGFITRAPEPLGNQAQQRLFTPWDLMFFSDPVPALRALRSGALTASLEKAFKPAPIILVCSRRGRTDRGLTC